MTTRSLVGVAVLLGATAFLGCRTSRLSYVSEGVAPSTVAPANVYLYLSNQSTEPRSVLVLSVYVDGVLQVRRSMRSVWANPNAPHDIPDEIPLHLPAGTHTIRVVAEGTRAGAEERITVGEAPVYVDAAFGFGTCEAPGSSSEASGYIHVSTERPGFC